MTRTRRRTSRLLRHLRGRAAAAKGGSGGADQERTEARPVAHRSWPVWLAAVLTLLMPLDLGSLPPVQHAAALVRETAASSDPATLTDYGDCGPDALPGTGLQGQIPRADQDSGRSKLGYRCNLRRIGHNDINARGANVQLAWYGDCAYVSTIGLREFFPSSAHELEGIAVIDAADPRRPKLVRTLRSPVARNVQHEALEVNQRRGMLVAGIGGIAARYLEIYDVSRDCRHPGLMGRYDAGAPTFHGVRISDDGATIYASDTAAAGSLGQVLHVIDVSNIKQPRLLKRWGPAEGDPANFFSVHDLELSADGRRAYLGAVPPSSAQNGLGLGGPANSGPTLVTLDTSEVQERRERPQLRVVSQIRLPNWGHAVQRARIGGEPYLIVSAESPWTTGLNCPWAWGYLIDMSDERHPKPVSELRLEVNLPENCERTTADGVAYSMHYAGVDDERNTTKVFYSYYGSGLRVFDVRDPAHPTEIAYYHPPPMPETVLKPVTGGLDGDNQTPQFDSVTSVIRYRPESGNIWVVSVGGGFHVLELTGKHACARTSANAKERGSRPPRDTGSDPGTAPCAHSRQR